MRSNRPIFFSLVALFFVLDSFGQQKGKINIYDSVSVKEYIAGSDICKQLKYVSRKISIFSDGVGFSKLILENISAKTGQALFIPVSNGGLILSKKDKISSLRNQILDLKKKNKCQSSS